MKECSRCKTTKDYSGFPRRTKAKDGRAPWCTQCFSEHSRQKYSSSAEERDRKRKNQNKILEKTRSYIYEYLAEHPCIICGESDPVVLEFDHRNPNEKDGNVSELIKFSLKKVQVEINKCDVMCANCHRRKTAEQFGTWKTTTGYGKIW